MVRQIPSDPPGEKKKKRALAKMTGTASVSLREVTMGWTACRLPSVTSIGRGYKLVFSKCQSKADFRRILVDLTVDIPSHCAVSESCPHKQL
jgi:hypothetical protein